MRLRAVTLGALAVAGMFGCAAPKPPAPAPSATAAFDGTYRGLARGSCGATNATAEVRDRRFVLAMFEGATRLEGNADRDGTLHGTQWLGDRELNFNGRVDGPDLRGGSYNGRCALAFALTRVDAARSVTSP